MTRDLPALARDHLDLLIIGGGILGAGIARDAALRGLKVGLIDKSDFASGTSSRSSKLIHGGFRYLEQYDFRLVAEGCRERRILQDIAPHLVKPLPLLLPVYDHSPRPLWKLRLGMTLYDLIAVYRNTAAHKTLRPSRVLEEEPSLNGAGLRGAIRFYDCQEDDARFCLDNVIHAAELGAACANYCEVVGLESRESRAVSARVVDRLTGDAFEVRAKAFVNAAGPWVDGVAGLAPAGTRVSLSPTKGVHLVVPRVTRGHGVFLQARRDARMMFILPWGQDYSIVGTTDTDFRGDPGAAYADENDVDYLLGELHDLMPDCGIGRGDVITTFAGVRPLMKNGATDPSARSREHRLIRHGDNLLTVAGGKYTTYRAIARQAVDEVYGMLGVRRPPACRTADTALPDRRPAPSGERIADSPVVHAGDVEHACRREMAVTVEDVMRRRTTLALSRFGGPETAEVVARQMARVLGWELRRMNESTGEYIDEWHRNRAGRAAPLTPSSRYSGERAGERGPLSRSQV